MKKILLAAISLILLPASANAVLITIDTDTTMVSQPSYAFGNYVFELVDPNRPAFNLIDAATTSAPEDFIVSNVFGGGDFTLRRLDNLAFSLVSLRFAGTQSTDVGGVALAGPGGLNFQNFSFSGQPGVTNVTSILFSPGGVIQISAFDAVVTAHVPEPETFLLLISGLVALGLSRRRRLLT